MAVAAGLPGQLVSFERNGRNTVEVSYSAVIGGLIPATLCVTVDRMARRLPK